MSLTRHYRDIAERMKTEKHEMENEMNERVELVHGFWRNNIKEGSSRAGKMVQRALLQKTIMKDIS